MEVRVCYTMSDAQELHAQWAVNRGPRWTGALGVATLACLALGAPPGSVILGAVAGPVLGAAAILWGRRWYPWSHRYHAGEITLELSPRGLVVRRAGDVGAWLWSRLAVVTAGPFVDLQVVVVPKVLLGSDAGRVLQQIEAWAAQSDVEPPSVFPSEPPTWTVASWSDAEDELRAVRFLASAHRVDVGLRLVVVGAVMVGSWLFGLSWLWIVAFVVPALLSVTLAIRSLLRDEGRVRRLIEVGGVYRFEYAAWPGVLGEKHRSGSSLVRCGEGVRITNLWNGPVVIESGGGDAVIPARAFASSEERGLVLSLLREGQGTPNVFAAPPVEDVG